MNHSREGSRDLMDSPADLDRLYARMGEPSWLILNALQALRTASRVMLTRQVAAVQASRSVGATPLDPSTLHYALKRMLSDGILEEVAEEEITAQGQRIAEARVAYRTKSHRPHYGLTPLGQQLLAARRQRIAVEVLMDTPNIKRPKPSIFGIADSGDGDLSERAGNERPKPREWRS